MLNCHIRILVHTKAPFPSSHPPQPNSEYIPSSLFQHLPAQKPKPTSRRNALFNPKHKDYRFGPIRIDWVDFETSSMSKVLNSGKEREKEPVTRGELVCSRQHPNFSL
jgi:BRCA1-associated protein